MNHAEVVIIGAGISGASIAYNLAKKGVKNIVVFDKSYFTAGATGRCGAGVRQQWATEGNCLMAKKSIEFFEIAKEELGYEGDIEFKQEGYLILACTKEEEQQFRVNVDLQQRLGIPSRVVDKDEALRIVPHLNKDAFLSATFCQTDGHLNPFKMTEAYYLAAKRLGVTFYFEEAVLNISLNHGKIESVITTKRSIRTSKVINAAGGYGKEIGALVGIDLPVYSENHEILATEPIEKIQGPMVISFSKNIYCQQVPHGSFLMGRSDPNVEKNHSVESTHTFLDEMAKTAIHILPLLSQLRVVRQWGGSYNMSPDRQPIIDASKEVEGFYMAIGFSGHGFMFAPMTGVLMSELLLNETPSLDMHDFKLERFNQDKTTAYEHSVV